MRCLGIEAGDEVLVPAMTFVASANAVEHTGATPVFVDSEPATGLIDLDAAERAITERTKAIMPVHLAGRPVGPGTCKCPAGQARVADRRGRRPRDRCALARKPVGTHGNLTAFSFYATKNITTIEGGALVTDDEAIAQRVEQLALHGSAWEPGTASRTSASSTTRPPRSASSST